MAAHQGPLSFTISQNLLKFMSIELVMPSNHLILCCPLLLQGLLFSNPEALQCPVWRVTVIYWGKGAGNLLLGERRKRREEDGRYIVASRNLGFKCILGILKRRALGSTWLAFSQSRVYRISIIQDWEAGHHKDHSFQVIKPLPVQQSFVCCTRESLGHKEQLVSDLHSSNKRYHTQCQSSHCQTAPRSSPVNCPSLKILITIIIDMTVTWWDQLCISFALLCFHISSCLHPHSIISETEAQRG